MAKLEGIDNIEFTQATLDSLTVTGTVDLLGEWTVASNGVLLSEGNVTQDYGLIGLNTNDGSDNRGLIMSAVNGVSDNRGASVEVYGNEYNAVAGISGSLWLRAPTYINFRTAGSNKWQLDANGDFIPNGAQNYSMGDSSNPLFRTYVSQVRSTNSTSDLFLMNDSANRFIRFYTHNGSASAERWRFEPAGHFLPATSASYNLGSSAARVDNMYLETFLNCRGSSDSNVWDIGAGGGSATFVVQTNSASQRDFSVVNNGGSARILLNGVQQHSETFTGPHQYAVKSGEVIEIGDAVRLENGEVARCSGSQDRLCIGIFMGEYVSTDPITLESGTIERIYDSYGQEYVRAGSPKNLARIASHGDSYTGSGTGAKICDEDGPVIAGDYLCTASKPGFLKRQTSDGSTYDNVKRDYTVAQIFHDVSFDGSGESAEEYVFLVK